MEKKEQRKQQKVLRRKAYEQPRIVHQQSLEVVAGVCEVAPGKPDLISCGYAES